jgi:hypothetical protein
LYICPVHAVNDILYFYMYVTLLTVLAADMDMPAAMIFPLLLHSQIPLPRTRNFQSLDKGMLI